MPTFIDLAGQTFTRLFVLWRGANHANGSIQYWCACVCGMTTLVIGQNLRNGTTRSCGCLRRETTIRYRTTHGGRRRPEYRSWSQMLQRCGNPKNPAFANYGGRGITVCERWQHSFALFLEDIGVQPSPQHSIERLNNNLGYAPANCTWATPIEQGRNTRTNIVLSLNGSQQVAAAWEKIVGIPQGTIRRRVRNGWSHEDALTRPIDPLKRGKSTNRFLTHAGKTQLLSEWAAEVGINVNTIRSRLFIMRWSIERTLTTPAVPRKRAL